MNITAEEFESGLGSGAFRILDVRESIEFNTFNLGGTNLPLGSLINSPEDLELQEDDAIVVVCQHGVRSQTACRILEQKGYTNVRNLSGGILAWRKLKQKRSQHDS